MTYVEEGIAITLMIAPEGGGSIHEVPVGLGELPSVVIRSTVEEGGVHVQVSTGAPFTQDANGLVGVADWLRHLANTLTSDEFAAAWVSETEGATDVPQD